MTNDHPVLKGASLWALVGVGSWSDVAAMLAALWSAVLISEWIWKRLLRQHCERRGWVKPKRRRRADDDTTPGELL